MSLDSFGKKLVKEAKRSPQKAAALIALAPIAMYFWLPLVTKNFRSKGSSKAAASVSVVETQAVGAGDQTDPAAEKEVAWKDAVSWISHDALTKPATLTAGGRDPFRVTSLPAAAELAVEPMDMIDEEKLQQFDPQDLRIELTATLFGMKTRTATINGRLRREGDRFDSDGLDIDTTDPVAFQESLVLTAIRPTYVVLAYKELRFELRLKKAAGGVAARSTGQDSP